MLRGGNEFFNHTDDLYNVTAITDSSGNVKERYEYGDFGEPNIIFTSGIGNPYFFKGRRYDDETGLYYYRTRYLDPVAGRFTSRDSTGIWGDSGNRATYAGNNPWSRLDPSGGGGGAGLAAERVLNPSILNPGMKPTEQQFRPIRVTPKPLIRAPQTVIVIGNSGEEIWPGKYGRIKVKFHWDREGKKDENSSCWIRVSQTPTGVDMFNKILNEGQAGDNIGALLRGTTGKDIERGQVLVAPGGGGGIIIPDTAKEKPQKGKVIAVGTDVGTGKVSFEVKRGDSVLFGKYSGNDIKIGGSEYVILREDEILGVLSGGGGGGGRKYLYRYRCDLDLWCIDPVVPSCCTPHRQTGIKR